MVETKPKMKTSEEPAKNGDLPSDVDYKLWRRIFGIT